MDDKEYIMDTTSKQYTYGCSLCDYKTDRKENITRHLKTLKCKNGEIVENNAEYTCIVCNKTFKTKYLLEKHQVNCFEKKAVVIEKLVNEEHIKQYIDKLIDVIKQFNEKIKNMEVKYDEEIKELKKENDVLREDIDKLKKRNLGDEEEEEEEDREYCNRVIDFEKVEARTFQNVADFLDITETQQIEYMTYDSTKAHKEQGNLMKNYIEMEDGTKFYFDTRDKKNTKTTSKRLYVYKPICCNNKGYIDEHDEDKIRCVGCKNLDDIQ